MGHADLIDIRKAHGKPDIHSLFFFHDRIDLPADIAGRFFHGHENLV